MQVRVLPIPHADTANYIRSLNECLETTINDFTFEQNLVVEYMGRYNIMKKTCNLSTVCNTPNEVRRSASRAEYYFIKTVHISDIDIDSDLQYKSVQCIIDMIYDVLEYSDLSVLDNAIVFGYHTDGESEPLFMFKNDIIKHSFRIIRLTDKIISV